MRVLVTGGFGFVGRHFVRNLLDEGHDVHVVDSLVPATGGTHPAAPEYFPRPARSKKLSFDLIDCREFFEQDSESWDLVIHLAAIVGGRLVIERDPIAVAEDLSIDASFWRFVSRSRPARVVHFSSSAAYPVALQAPENFRRLVESDIDFSGPLGLPDMTYGWAKLTSEYLARFFSDDSRTEVYNFRPFSGYGEDQDASYPVPAIVDRALAHSGEEFAVWGSGLQSRDFIYIDDIVNIVVGLLNRPSRAAALNLGTGIGTNFVQLADLALSITGGGARIVPTSSMPEGVFYRVSDTRLQETLSPLNLVSLREGLVRVAEYRSFLLRRRQES